MTYLLALLHISLWQGIIILIAALLIGIGKTGISAAVLLAIPLLATEFGAKESTGIMLVIFILGDLLAVKAYREYVNTKEILQLLPPSVAGIIIGAFLGNIIDARTFKIVIALIILVCVGAMLFLGRKSKDGKEASVPHSIWFVVFIGVLCGFTTMIGNAAGPIFAIYLLAMGFEKKYYLGTTAWFFFAINLIKLPIQVFAWHNISPETVGITLLALPVLYLGTVIGIRIVKIMNEKTFRYVIVIMTVAAAVRLLF